MAKYLITKLVVDSGGKWANVFAKGHKFPTMKLFDLGELSLVGIDPTTLQKGVETPCRFWAHYKNSDKLNNAGNPYKNITHLEACGTANSDSPERWLRDIRDILLAIAKKQGVVVEWSESEDEEEEQVEEQEQEPVRQKRPVPVIPDEEDDDEIPWGPSDAKQPAPATQEQKAASAARVSRIKNMKNPKV